MRFVDDFGICGPDRYKLATQAHKAQVAQMESKVTRIIVLAGQKGNGKDTAAEALTQRGYLYAPLAGALKAMLKTLLSTMGVSGETQERLVNGDLKEAPCAKLGGLTMRHAMQTLGTEWGRKCMGETFWLDTWRRRWGGAEENIVITDCRFANEAEYLKKMGAEIFVIKRPGFVKPATHSSEDLSWADGYPVIWNDGSVELLHQRVLASVKP